MREGQGKDGEGRGRMGGRMSEGWGRTGKDRDGWGEEGEGRGMTIATSTCIFIIARY